ncbi:hypothetical protein [Streptomyces scabiei]|uniref:hypothetical protein n=1 Tax=Streptomyces scabiei TaxID=1930 RepID=UPI002FF25261
MTTSSHRPFGFHMPGPMPAPVPLHQAPAAQPAPAVPPAFTGTVPLVVPLARREPVPVCVTCGARHGALVPSGDCYESGALKFVCASRDCVPGPLEPAVLTGPEDAQPRPPLTPARTWRVRTTRRPSRRSRRRPGCRSVPRCAPS